MLVISLKLKMNDNPRDMILKKGSKPNAPIYLVPIDQIYFMDSSVDLSLTHNTTPKMICLSKCPNYEGALGSRMYVADIRDAYKIKNQKDTGKYFLLAEVSDCEDHAFNNYKGSTTCMSIKLSFNQIARNGIPPHSLDELSFKQ